MLSVLLCVGGGPSFLWSIHIHSSHRGDSCQHLNNCQAFQCGSSFGDRCSVPRVVYQITGIEKYVMSSYSVIVNRPLLASYHCSVFSPSLQHYLRSMECSCSQDVEGALGMYIQPRQQDIHPLLPMSLRCLVKTNHKHEIINLGARPTAPPPSNGRSQEESLTAVSPRPQDGHNCQPLSADSPHRRRRVPH